MWETRESYHRRHQPGLVRLLDTSESVLSLLVGFLLLVPPRVCFLGSGWQEGIGSSLS